MAATSLDGSRVQGDYREVRGSSRGRSVYSIRYEYAAQGRTYHGSAGWMRPRFSAKTGELLIAYSRLCPWFSYPVGMAGEKLGFGLLSLAVALLLWNWGKIGLGDSESSPRLSP